MADQKEQLSLDSAARHILEECRMVLPGIQALFGFQLIAVFNQGFSDKLSTVQQQLHFISIILTICAVALVMSPAALHRQIDPLAVTRRVYRIEYNAVAFEHGPTRAKYIFRTLHYRPDHHRIILAQFPGRWRSPTFILFAMGFAAKYRAKRPALSMASFRNRQKGRGVVMLRIPIFRFDKVFLRRRSRDDGKNG